MIEKYITFQVLPNGDVQKVKYTKTYPAIPSEKLSTTKVYKVLDVVENFQKRRIDYTSPVPGDNEYKDLIKNMSADYEVLYQLNPTYCAYMSLILRNKKDNTLYLADEIYHSMCVNDMKHSNHSWVLSKLKEVKAKVSAAQRKKEEGHQRKQATKTLFDTFILPTLTEMLQSNGLKIRPVASQANTYEIYVFPATLSEHIAKALRKTYPGVYFKPSCTNAFYQTTRLCTFKADDFVNCMGTLKETI